MENNAEVQRAPEEDRKRVEELVKTLLSGFGSYHADKERMAYAGMAAYLAVFGTALVTKDWPPPWPVAPEGLRWFTVIVMTLVALMFVGFMKWQLRRRRWAALRVGGMQRLLARWTWRPPTTDELRQSALAEESQPPRWKMILDYFWPVPEGVRAIRPDVEEVLFPRVLVEAWKDQERRGTRAINHERMLIASAWLIWAFLVWRTMAPAIAGAASTATPVAPSLGRQWLSVAGLGADLIGALILAIGLVISRERALQLGLARWASSKPEENLNQPQVQDRLAQSRNALVGGILLIVGFLLQIVAQWPR